MQEVDTQQAFEHALWSTTCSAPISARSRRAAAYPAARRRVSLTQEQGRGADPEKIAAPSAELDPLAQAARRPCAPAGRRRAPHDGSRARCSRLRAAPTRSSARRARSSRKGLVGALRPAAREEGSHPRAGEQADTAGEVAERWRDLEERLTRALGGPVTIGGRRGRQGGRDRESATSASTTSSACWIDCCRAWSQSVRACGARAAGIGARAPADAVLGPGRVPRTASKCVPRRGTRSTCRAAACSSRTRRRGRPGRRDRDARSHRADRRRPRSVSSVVAWRRPAGDAAAGPPGLGASSFKTSRRRSAR